MKMPLCRRLLGRGSWTKGRRVILLLTFFSVCGYLYHYNEFSSGNELSFNVVSRTIKSLSKGTSRASLQLNGSIDDLIYTADFGVTVPELSNDSILFDDVTLNETELSFIPQANHGSTDVKFYFAETIKQSGPGFTLITMFHLFTGQDVEGYDKETKDSLLTRNSEYMSVIKENINHPQLKRLVLLYTHPATMKVLVRQNWPNVTKVYPVKMDRMIHMADFFNISSSFLLDEPVIGSNGDIIIGEGFERINTERLRDTKTIYSLTRHGNKGVGECKAKSMCLMKYYGSHDTHIFRLKEPLSNEVLSILNYPVNLQQAENGMIGTMTLKAGYTVYNPCSILTTYHVHCSRIGTRYVKGHNSIRNQPWSVRNVKTSPPVSELKYGPQKRSR